MESGERPAAPFRTKSQKQHFKHVNRPRKHQTCSIIYYKMIQTDTQRVLSSCSSSRGEVSSPTYSPRPELVAAALFTQIRIYRVYIDDRWSDIQTQSLQPASTGIKHLINNIHILKTMHSYLNLFIIRLPL